MERSQARNSKGGCGINGDISLILQHWDRDPAAAIAQLTPLVRAELLEIASRYLHGTQPDHKLKARALINEAYLKLVPQDAVTFTDRSHFFALAAKLLRAILVDFARASAERGAAGLVRLDGEIRLSEGGDFDLLSLHEALGGLEAHDARKAAVIELGYFGGLTFEEIAEALGISMITAKRDTASSEVWLRRALSRKG